MNNKRNYGIDLLRIILMFMVCMLHTLGHGGILSSSPFGTLQHKTFYLLEVASYCAVDSFAMISGYMAINKPQKYEKLVEMWFQVVFYSFVVTSFFSIIGIYSGFEIKEMIKCAMPMTFSKFWYFTAYFGLFFVMPLLNQFISSIDEKTARIGFLILILPFSVIETLFGVFKTNGLYSVFGLIILYCIGGFAKKGRIFEKTKTSILIIAWLVCLVTTWLVIILFNNTLLMFYQSPTILFCGLLMVIIFSRIPTKGTLIKLFSPFIFGVYLFHQNQVIWGYLKGTFSFVSELPVLQGVLYAFLIASIIFISGLCVVAVRSKLSKLIGIPTLSKKIVQVIKSMLFKASKLLD